MKLHKKGVDQVDGATIRRLMGYLQGRYKWRFAAVLILIVLSALASVAGSLFIGNVIDNYITPMLTQAVPNFAPLLRAIGVMAGIYLMGVLSTLFYNRIMVTIAQSILKDIRDEMFKRMQCLPIGYFDTHSHGDIMSHYTNDTDTLRQMMSQSIPQTFSSLITIVSVFFAMLFTSWPLTILVLVTIYLMIMLSGKIAGASSRYFVRQQDSIGVVNGYIEEMMHGQKVVKVFCHEEASKAGFDVRNEDLFKNAAAANTYANILMPIMANCGNLQYVLVAIVGAVLMLNGITPLTLGGLVAFLTLTKNFSMPVSQISQQLNAIIMALAGAKRIFTLMDEAPEEDEGYVTLVNVSRRDGKLVEANHRTGLWAWKHPHQADGSVTYHELKGEVRFYNVDFEYVINKPILQDITLYAEPGQKLALVGATGAGKTTITNLINRFYDIADGKIRYDGININKIKKPDLRRSLGIVLQDTNLFTGTVMENIRYGNLNASDDEVMAAARLANADDFIRRLPQGYETQLDSEGGSLSQGQCQLISIARAAVADPPVMILDEATSSIDTRTEALVQAGMDSLMIGRTVFVIAHRLSTIKNADAIMVMEQGRIIERGNHDALMNEHGEYYQLYTGGLELE
ncbi:ATP-binding cassette, subfamily B [Eubacterium barkeri]|uniref:ATP-binding cassette, subfamily B n=1 Tax=Eubacterium barkeri TaxID=1528 RepID=A0A1H3DNP6_EUBBA|nr:ATP-binding cassette, subfamily B [Eubacterium barkeri]